MSAHTIIKWSRDWSNEQAFAEARGERSSRFNYLAGANKVVSPAAIVATGTWSVNWADRATADEWVAFITELSTRYSLPLVSATAYDGQFTSIVENKPAVV